jgi:hypothetical protein
MNRGREAQEARNETRPMSALAYTLVNILNRGFVVRSLVAVFLLLSFHFFAHAEEMSWEQRMEKFTENGDRVGRAHCYEVAALMTFKDEKEVPLLVEMIGKFASRKEGEELRFDQRRQQARLDELVTFESGIRQPKAIRTAFDIRPLRPSGMVRVVETDVRRDNQFAESFYGLNPAYFSTQHFVHLQIGRPFSKDRMVALKIVESGIDEKGCDWIAIASLVSGGLCVYRVTFDKKTPWLITEFRVYEHPDFGGNDALPGSNADPVDYKNWINVSNTLTSWMEVDGLHVPSRVRMRERDVHDKTGSDVTFNFRNWNFDEGAVKSLINLEEFKSENLPDGKYFEQLEFEFEQDATREREQLAPTVDRN